MITLTAVMVTAGLADAAEKREQDRRQKALDSLMDDGRDYPK
jgi:hypothetical protein